MRILMVDDDKLLLLKLKEFLISRGHEVITAQNGEEGFKAFKDESIRIIIRDWIMPECSGLEFCRRVRAVPDREYCYFILVTGNIGEDKYWA